MAVGSGQSAVAIESYRDLRVWHSAVDLSVEAYAATRSFPKEETYGLTSQIRRSATSVAANIAEGYGRNETGSYVQFLRIARGSLKEFETHIHIARRLQLLTDEREQTLFLSAKSIGKMLNSLIRKIGDSSVK
jgi:four helix bundle protein